MLRRRTPLIGNTRITNDPRPNTNHITPAQFQAAIDKIAAGPNAGARCVKSIDFYSCNTGRNTAGNPAGTMFLNALQASIPSARLPPIYPSLRANPRVQPLHAQAHPGARPRFDVGAGGALGSFQVPEISSLVLLGTAFGAVLIVYQRRRETGVGVCAGKAARSGHRKTASA
jgi:hypothetical protein